MNIQNNLTAARVLMGEPQQDALQIPTQATPGRHFNDETSSSGSSAELVPGVNRLVSSHGCTDGTRIGESLEALRLANKEASV